MPSVDPPGSVINPLWQCQSCGRAFANRNQTHACRPLGTIDQHFASSDPLVRATFDRILQVVTDIGPVTVLSERTRIALQVRMSFAAVMPRRHWLNGHLVLDHRVESPRFAKIEVYSPRNVLHAFQLRVPGEVDTEFTAWLTQSYRVGQ